MKFNPITVKHITQLTNDSVKITLDIPSELKSDYQFVAGEYITLDLNGERRDYSLCTSPLNNEWSFAVKSVEGGKISVYLNKKLKVGDTLMISAPRGRFGIPSKPNEKRTLLAFAAGSGITPILSIIEYTLQTEKWVNFYLFYSNKTSEDVMFAKEIDDLRKKYPDNFIPYLFYTKTPQEDWLFEGRLNAHKFQLITNQLIDINEVDEVMICGPEEMIIELAQEIYENGIPKKHIHFELFNPSVDSEKIITEEKGPEKVNLTVQLDGEITNLIWNRDKNLIDSILDAGLDAPYSCKGGICSSCMCKVEEGNVHLGNNFVLTDTDKKNGLILACVSRPKSSILKINFDAV